MLVLLVKRGDSNSGFWFWVPLVSCLRKVPITHYKPAPSGGADDILQLEHTGIYKLQIPPELETLSEISAVHSLQGQEDDELLLNESTLQTVYETFRKLIPLFTTCSNGQIIHSNGDVSYYDITGWSDDMVVKNVLIFGKLNTYRSSPTQADSSSGTVTQSGLLSIPKDTVEVKLISISRIETNNTTRYNYNELLSLVVQNRVRIGNDDYNPNTLNLHLHIGEVISLKVTQRATYIINTKSKNITQHIYPPTVHGYGTTLVPMNGNRIIERILDDFVDLYREQEHNNQLFYDVL